MLQVRGSERRCVPITHTKLAQAYTSRPRPSLGDSPTQPLAFARWLRPGPWDGAAAQADVSVGSRADWTPWCEHLRIERYSGTLLAHELGRDGEFPFREGSCGGQRAGGATGPYWHVGTTSEWRVHGLSPRSLVPGRHAAAVWRPLRRNGSALGL